LVPISELRANLKKVLRSQGHSYEASDIITETILFAELRNNNQGIVKVLAGALKPSDATASISVVRETPISAQIDGGHNIGMVVVKKAMDIALAKARTSGVGIVGCSNYASATGALGAWAREIARNDFIGIVMSQCPEMVAPHGSYEPIFGTNPLAIGIPTKPRPQVLDMATSAAAWFGLVSAKEEGQSIPDDIAFDSKGYPTTDPTEAMKGALRVFDRSYKGSHLALMVELLAGALTGATMTDKQSANNWGSLIIVIDPKLLGPLEDFQERADSMCQRVKNAKRLPDFQDGEIYLPGERGDQLEAENIARGTIKMSSTLYGSLAAMAEACKDETRE
jgi:LDH2 family malate/lactate/ureidoglycolate dehydrogenase